jgi:hypothetical protein
LALDVSVNRIGPETFRVKDKSCQQKRARDDVRVHTQIAITLGQADVACHDVSEHPDLLNSCK